MTREIDEAIERYTSNAEYERTHGNLQGYLEFKQLAEWLRDYKRLKEQEPSEDAISREAVLDLIADYDLSMGQVVRGIHTLPSVKQQPCEDAISRKAVLDTISELNAISFYEAQEDSKECYYEIRQAIEDLSPVKPQTGHWITEIESNLGDDMWPTNPRCSKCGGEPYYSNSIHNYKFCPYCGARMVEPQETKQPEISSYYGLKSYVRERSEE